MAKRTPETAARNKRIASLSDELKEIREEVMMAMGSHSVSSLHGVIGGKYAEYIDIKNEIIHSSEHFVALWLQGFQAHLNSFSWEGSSSNIYKLYKVLKVNRFVKEYLYKFLTRTYLKNYEALSKKRPKIEESEVWIGQKNANYGILITPRFESGKWENDKSEIRHFEPKYWSIGHILETGLVIPGKDHFFTFPSVEHYLEFFLDVIVRNSGSRYEYALASKYCDYVKSLDNQLDVPLLIPEFRYGGLATKHKYRLDFTIIESGSLNKIGIELSPWSTHGYLSKIGKLNQAQINEMAKGNFEKEMKKHKDFFRKHGIFTLIYTDSELKDMDKIFDDILKYMTPSQASVQLKFHIIDEFFG